MADALTFVKRSCIEVILKYLLLITLNSVQSVIMCLTVNRTAHVSHMGIASPVSKSQCNTSMANTRSDKGHFFLSTLYDSYHPLV